MACQSQRMPARRPSRDVVMSDQLGRSSRSSPGLYLLPDDLDQDARSAAPIELSAKDLLPRAKDRDNTLSHTCRFRSPDAGDYCRPGACFAQLW
jgi:hypothetical protein